MAQDSRQTKNLCPVPSVSWMAEVSRSSDGELALLVSKLEALRDFQEFAMTPLAALLLAKAIAKMELRAWQVLRRLQQRRLRQLLRRQRRPTVCKIEPCLELVVMGVEDAHFPLDVEHLFLAVFHRVRHGRHTLGGTQLRTWAARG